jgi:hypothetical protein
MMIAGLMGMSQHPVDRLEMVAATWTDVVGMSHTTKGLSLTTVAVMKGMSHHPVPLVLATATSQEAPLIIPATIEAPPPTLPATIEEAHRTPLSTMPTPTGRPDATHTSMTGITGTIFTAMVSTKGIAKTDTIIADNTMAPAMATVRIRFPQTHQMSLVVSQTNGVTLATISSIHVAMPPRRLLHHLLKNKILPTIAARPIPIVGIPATVPTILPIPLLHLRRALLHLWRALLHLWMSSLPLRLRLLNHWSRHL